MTGKDRGSLLGAIKKEQKPFTDKNAICSCVCVHVCVCVSVFHMPVTDKTYKVPGFRYLIYRDFNGGLIKQVHRRHRHTLPSLIHLQ